MIASNPRFGFQEDPAAPSSATERELPVAAHRLIQQGAKDLLALVVLAVRCVQNVPNSNVFVCVHAERNGKQKPGSGPDSQGSDRVRVWL